MSRPSRLAVLAAHALAVPVALLFLYPYWWMLIGAFRTTRAMMADPLRLLPETFDVSILRQIARVGGVDLWVYAANSVVITFAATLLGVAVTAMGAYALARRPDLPGFATLRRFFLVTIMYPYMLLVIPVYVVLFKLGLLGTRTGIVLFLTLGPIQFFLFERFFRAIPREVIEAAQMDGASELRISPDTYTLPVALLAMNTELGSNVQGIMALAVIATLPVAVVFLLAQRRVMQGMAAGAVKG